MSGEFDDENAFKLEELDTLPIADLRSLYRKVVNELQSVKVEFEEF